MRKVLDRLYKFAMWTRVIFMVLAALFILFWLYKFLRLPFSNELAILFDLPSKLYELPFETLQYYKGREIQHAYFINSLIFAFISFIFYLITNFVQELQRRYEINDLQKRKVLQEEMNKNLKQEYMDGLYKYDFISAYLKFELDYVTEILANNNPTTIEAATKRTYDYVYESIKKYFPQAHIRRDDGYIFLIYKGFDNLENFVDMIIGTIKSAKKLNEKDYIALKFTIVLDVQTTEAEALSTFNNLNEVANSNYKNKALATLTFKTRFDLLNSSNYLMDILGYASSNNFDTVQEGDIYVLKSKPKD